MDSGAVALPAGFRSHVANIGIKDETDDFLVLAADAPCPAAAVFTRSRFAGPSVTLSRRHVADGRLQAFVVVSKNANVANGPSVTPTPRSWRRAWAAPSAPTPLTCWSRRRG